MLRRRSEEQYLMMSGYGQNMNMMSGMSPQHLYGMQNSHMNQNYPLGQRTDENMMLQGGRYMQEQNEPFRRPTSIRREAVEYTNPNDDYVE